jgi:hypothetical protein
VLLDNGCVERGVVRGVPYSVSFQCTPGGVARFAFYARRGCVGEAVDPPLEGVEGECIADKKEFIKFFCTPPATNDANVSTGPSGPDTGAGFQLPDGTGDDAQPQPNPPPSQPPGNGNGNDDGDGTVIISQGSSGVVAARPASGLLLLLLLLFATTVRLTGLAEQPIAVQL